MVGMLPFYSDVPSSNRTEVNVRLFAAKNVTRK